MVIEIRNDRNAFIMLELLSYKEMCQYSYPCDLDENMVYLDMFYDFTEVGNGSSGTIEFQKDDLLNFFILLRKNIRRNKNFCKKIKDENQYDVLMFNLKFEEEFCIFTVKADSYLDLVTIVEKMSKDRLYKIMLQLEEFLKEV